MHVASPSCKLALYGKRLATVNYNKTTYLDDTLGGALGEGGVGDYMYVLDEHASTCIYLTLLVKFIRVCLCVL